MRIVPDSCSVSFLGGFFSPRSVVYLHLENEFEKIAQRKIIVYSVKSLKFVLNYDFVANLDMEDLTPIDRDVLHIIIFFLFIAQFLLNNT